MVMNITTPDWDVRTAGIDAHGARIVLLRPSPEGSFGEAAKDRAMIQTAPRLYECLEAIEFAARLDCPRTEAWKNLLTTCRVALALARGEQ